VSALGTIAASVVDGDSWNLNRCLDRWQCLYYEALTEMVSNYGTDLVVTLLSNRLLKRFELIDYPSFCSMLDLSSGQSRKQWQQLLDQEQRCAQDGS
jgi:hypothetical protein